jgi:hypothetical protein
MANSNAVRIGVACPIPGERAAFLEWLTLAGYEPVPMISIDNMTRELTTRPIEALIADVSLIPKNDLQRVVKVLGANRSLIVVGAREKRIEDVPRDATWMERPVTRDAFLLSVALGLAEGRPSRRFPRKMVPALMSSIDGISSRLMDISVEGVRLEIIGAAPSTLPPFFTLKVPGFGVATKVKRVWVASPTQGAVWCGGVIDKPSANQVATWRKFIANAPQMGQQIIHETPASI